MIKKILWAMIIVGAFAPAAYGAGSPAAKPAVKKEIQYYNKGVDLMLDKKFAKAEKRFRKALAKRERFAEAHNNLAYVLRKQGPENYDEALNHYNRAIALKPGLPQPYMYRGVLYVQMGRADLAKKDHTELAKMNPELAAELEYVIETGSEKEPEQFFGVSKKK